MSNMEALFSGDFGKMLPAMKLIQDIEAKITGDENGFAIGIRKSIKANVPYLKIIAEIKTMIEDNEDMVSGWIGYKLMDRVKKF